MSRSRGVHSAVSEAPIQNPSPDAIRHLADFHPTVWGDYFLKYSSNATGMISSDLHEQVQVLKEDVRKMLTVAIDKPSQQLNLIDAIQRLGIAYLFEREIEEALEKLHNYNARHDHCDNDGDLYTIALRFRLLRQQGYSVSSDVFEMFKSGNGDFKEDLARDVRGLLSLYEASHLSVHGERILDEALAFTTTHLASMSTKLTPPVAGQVSRALKRPIRKGLTRQEAQHYISLYQQDEMHIEALLKLAKLDFNIVQKLHQEELSIVTRWWKDLDFPTKLPFIRDRVTEGYYWPLEMLLEPQYRLGRMMLTKVIAILSVIDDIYDAYGTLVELELFTEVIERFDTGMMDQLPDYMKLCYQALVDLYGEIEEAMIKEGRSFCMFYAKDAIKKIARAYLVEARWLHENIIPTTEEYIRNGMISSVCPMLITISFIGMGEIATKEALDWVFTEPKMLKAASTICRLMGDIVSHKFEQSRGHVASVVECYIREHGASEEEAYDELNKIVANAWKDINEELLKSTTAAPRALLYRILNFARVIDVVYKDEDRYTHSKSGFKNLRSSHLVTHSFHHFLVKYSDQ